ncbi:hypothetical protein A4H97_24250 [Niastella yeongjuensis]|uniref:HNH nuclease domain-containing protein n=1 Tax=Niastella yeongjuensis TaxID=354355 RepID=A0A1V9F3L5_9BACT|nr:NUMOD4 domain-containing protein [Niastella yeongjuensis]OQP52815.1 hypothetical protein A4H97_24250 [Niastella yeongjuensis]SEP20379.1 NUMOD4 motif-containing protein [Niastella yeongjuensis]
MTTQEHRVPIPNYEQFYEINTLGTIRSINRRILTKSGYYKPEKERIITQRISNKGYLSVTLSKYGQSTTHYVHRLLALVFISNPYNKPIINHRNGNKLDNSIENLESVTYSENAIHAYKTGLYKSNERKRRLILDACTGETYTSIKKAAVHLNINYATCRNYLSGHSPNRTCLQYAA